MNRLATLALALALAGCASNPAPPGTIVSGDRLAAAVVQGQTTRAELIARFGKTRTVVFDSGYEVWLYQSPAAAAFRSL